MATGLYPLKFQPILKERIWGGQRLRTVLKKQSNHSNIGESWEISDVKGDISIVSNGSLKGQSLKQVQQTYAQELIGLKNHKLFKDQFPLLIKFIDAKEDLSIQLHPNDALAANRHNSFGKNEMWYVMQADEGSKLIVGFNKKVTPELYLKHLGDKSLTKILNFENVAVGDTYFIQVGRVHAIGAGVMLAEIQQTSDITYRIYDWDRVDERGHARELHNDLAMEAIDFDLKDDFKVNYLKVKNRSVAMVKCPYFATNYVHVTTTLKKTNLQDSFMIYICVKGEATIKTEEHLETLKMGETVLLPAIFTAYEISAENATLLEVYV